MEVQRLTVGLSPRVSAHAPELKYVFRTLLRIAGFGVEFVWADTPGSASLDIYYGPRSDTPARLRIDASALTLSEFRRDPVSVREEQGLPICLFPGDPAHGLERLNDPAAFGSDIIRTCFWLLTGSSESSLPRDRWDNIDLSNAFVFRHGLLERPVVSLYAAFLREFFRKHGMTPLPLPWTGGGAAAFCFSHDVDYPEMIRWIEAVRLLRMRGIKAFPSLVGVVKGSNHFWKFADWVHWQRQFGTQPAFYFSAVQGSFLRYVTGTPDCFYDVRSPRFHELFRYLADEGCEIGLHASFRSHEEPGRIATERASLQEASGATVDGNRHHYWRLNPKAPHETLVLHERAGFTYDSSLGFEYGPGFRRAICHPFHVYHPGERREVRTLQLPPAWMDDHFDRRLAWNGIRSPEVAARTLLDVARATGGMVLVDYHARGMNSDFFPRYGPWLAEFVQRHCGSGVRFARPIDLARSYIEYEAKLDAASLDHCLERSASRAARPLTPTPSPPRLAVVTLEGSHYGKALLQGLAARNVSVALVVVVANPLTRKLRMLRSLAERVGWADALVYAMEEVLSPSGPSDAAARRLSYADLGLPLHRVSSLREPGVADWLRNQSIDVLLLGQAGIVPEEVLEAPSVGTLNAHPGILPSYRGVDCSAWALLRRDFANVGSSLHWVNAGIDTGPIVRCVPYRWRGDETLSLLSARLYDDCIGMLVDAAITMQRESLVSVPNVDGTQHYRMPRALRRQAARALEGISRAS
jgi:hypothetical protein